MDIPPPYNEEKIRVEVMKSEGRVIAYEGTYIVADQHSKFKAVLELVSMRLSPFGKVLPLSKAEKVQILMTATGCIEEAAALGLKNGKSKTSYAKNKRRKSCVDSCSWKFITEEAVNTALSAGGLVTAGGVIRWHTAANESDEVECDESSESSEQENPTAWIEERY